MKYIVMSVKGKGSLSMEVPFIFPDICVHVMVSTIVKVLLEDQFEGATVQAVSAGFLSSTSFGDECYGKSETLKLSSRGSVDDALIKMCDYGSIYM